MHSGGKVPPALSCGGFPAGLAGSESGSLTASFEAVLRAARSLMFRAAFRSAFVECPQCLQTKLSLALAIGLLTVAAGVARPGRTTRIDQGDRHAYKLGLVLHEQPQLKEAPSRVTGSVFGSNSCPLAYPFKVFKADAALGVFGLPDQSFADTVVLVLAKPGFSARQFLEPFLRSLASFLLEPLAVLVMPASSPFDGFTRIGLAVAVGGNIDDAKVNAKEALGSIGAFSGISTVA